MATVVNGSTRRLLVVRHSERCDYYFKKRGVKWIESAFDANGHYRRFDPQMPLTLAARSGGPHDYTDDTPITASGYAFCVRTETNSRRIKHISGELLRERGIVVNYAYSSPAYRCVQTTQGIIEGEFSSHTLMQKYSGLDAKEMKIRIEPGLFQWMHWCKHGLPPFMNAEQFNRAGFSIDLSYKAIDDAAKFDEKETLLDYYNRSFALVRGILDSHPEGTILLVGHAGSLDTLTRQLSGKKPRERAEFRQFLHKTSYLAINEVIERNNEWKVIGSPIPSLINSGLDRC
uniref:Protein UBASH3A-like protein n=2 Tax=Ascaris TaxID=6251 RepID=A0A0M3HF06_ASCLU